MRERVEVSCGAVVYTRRNGQLLFLLIQSLKGIWGFPKGHMEAGETETQTALREVLEETGVQVRLMPEFREDVPARWSGQSAWSISWAPSGNRRTAVRKRKWRRSAWCRRSMPWNC